MRKISRATDIFAVPATVWAGIKATYYLWPIDAFLAVITAGVFFVLFLEFLNAALWPEVAA